MESIFAETQATQTQISEKFLQSPLWPFPEIVPRDVQIDALQAAQGKAGFAFFMRQRLGKTLTAYAEYVNLRNMGIVDYMFIICPNSLKQQWLDAIEEANMFETIVIYDSAKKKTFDKFFTRPRKQAVIIINYESMKAFLDDKQYLKFDPIRTYAIADESTKIKGASTSTAKACLEFASMCSYTRVLSGKPRANNNADMWAQLKFIRATNRNYHQHKYFFCRHGGYMGNTIVEDINTDILQAEMAPHVYIAPDKYVKGFQKIYEPLRRVQLLPDQLKMYKEMETNLVLSLGEDTSITAPIALVKYLRLQQISSGIAGDPDGKQHNLIDPFSNPKIRAVSEVIESDIDGKVIIVCRFRLSIDNLFMVLKLEGHKVAKLVGGMTSEEVEKAKADFNGTGANILIAQTQVLNFGHTLPGHKDFPCKDMIFFENDFSLINRSQCESRPEEYGRDGAVSYWDFYASKMDKYIMSRLRDKEDGAMALMNYSRDSGFRPPSEDF